MSIALRVRQKKQTRLFTMNPELPRKKHLRKHKEKIDPEMMASYHGYPDPEFMLPRYGMDPGFEDPSYLQGYEHPYYGQEPNFIGPEYGDYPFDIDRYPVLSPENEEFSPFLRNQSMMDHPLSKMGFFPGESPEAPPGLGKIKKYAKLGPIQKNSDKATINGKKQRNSQSAKPAKNKSLIENDEDPPRYFGRQKALFPFGKGEEEAPKTSLGKKIFGSLNEARSARESSVAKPNQSDPENSEWQDIADSSSCSLSSSSAAGEIGKHPALPKKQEGPNKRGFEQVKEQFNLYDASALIAENDEATEISKLSYQESAGESEEEEKESLALGRNGSRGKAKEVPTSKNSDFNVRNDRLDSKLSNGGRLPLKASSPRDNKNEKQKSPESKSPGPTKSPYMKNNEASEEYILEDYQNRLEMLHEEYRNRYKIEKEKLENETNLMVNKEKERLKIESQNKIQALKDELSRGRDETIDELCGEEFAKLNEKLKLEEDKNEKLESSYNAIVSQLNKEKDELQSKLDDIKKEHERKVVELEEKYKFECELAGKLKETLDAEKERNQALSGQEALQNEKFRLLSSELLEIRETSDKTLKVKERLEEEKLKSLKETSDLKKDFEAKLSQFAIEEQNLKDANVKLKQNLNISNRDKENLEREVLILKNQVKTFDEKFSHLDESKKLENLRESEEQIAKLQHELSLANKEKERLEKDNLRIKKDNYNLEETIAFKKETLKQKEEESKMIQNENIKLQENVELTASSNLILEKETESLREEVKTLKERREKDEDELELFRSEIKSLRDLLSNKNNEVQLLETNYKLQRCHECKKNNDNSPRTNPQKDPIPSHSGLLLTSNTKKEGNGPKDEAKRFPLDKITMGALSVEEGSLSLFEKDNESDLKGQEAVTSDFFYLEVSPPNSTTEINPNVVSKKTGNEIKHLSTKLTSCERDQARFNISKCGPTIPNRGSKTNSLGNKLEFLSEKATSIEEELNSLKTRLDEAKHEYNQINMIDESVANNLDKSGHNEVSGEISSHTKCLDYLESSERGPSKANKSQHDVIQKTWTSPATPWTLSRNSTPKMISNEDFVSLGEIPDGYSMKHPEDKLKSDLETKLYLFRNKLMAAQKRILSISLES